MNTGLTQVELQEAKRLSNMIAQMFNLMKTEDETGIAALSILLNATFKSAMHVEKESGANDLCGGDFPITKSMIEFALKGMMTDLGKVVLIEDLHKFIKERVYGSGTN